MAVVRASDIEQKRCRWSSAPVSLQSHWMQEGIKGAVESRAAVARCLQEHGISQVDIQEGGAALPHLTKSGLPIWSRRRRHE